MKPSVKNAFVHANRLDALAEALTPAVHVALDQAPSDALREAVNAAASRHVRRRARVIARVWSGATAIAAAAALAVCAWWLPRQQAAQRMKTLDHLLVLASESEALPEKRDLAVESLAKRLLFLQGFDAGVTTPEEVEYPEPPAIDVRSRSTLEHRAKRYG